MSRRRGVWSRKADDYQALLERSRFPFVSDYCAEPRLRFADDRLFANPKLGIAEHGPLEEYKYKPVVRVGVIGTQPSIDHFSSYITTISGNVSTGVNSRNKPFDP